MSYTQQLQKSTLFKGVSESDLLLLESVMQQQSFAAGAILFQKGDIGDTLYLILSGTLRIYTYDGQGNELTLELYGPMHIVGDFALIDQRPRSATAQVEDAVIALTLTRAAFLDLLPKAPSLGLAMIRNLADRVRHVTNYLSKVNNFVEQLAAGDYEKAIKEVSTSTVAGSDSQIDALFAAYIKMVDSIQKREAKLKQAPSPTQPQTDAPH